MYKDKSMTERNVTVSINTDTYKEIKKIALLEETSIKQVINGFLADGVQKHKGQTKL